MERKTESVNEPARVLRIGSMVKQLLDEVRSAPLDEKSRVRLREIYEQSIHELSEGLSPDLVAELDRMALPFDSDAPSDSELRIAQAQLVGWLEGLFQGIQASLMSQQMAARAQLEEMRQRGLPSAGESGTDRRLPLGEGRDARLGGMTNRTDYRRGRHDVGRPAVGRPAVVPRQRATRRRPPPHRGPPAFPVGGAGPGRRPTPRSIAATRPTPSWGIRLGGYLIDTVIFAVVVVVLLVVFRHSNTLEVHLMARRGTTRRRHISAVPFLITAVLYVVYGTVLCGSKRGQTVGMMAVGVRAVREGSFGVLGYGRALARAVVEGVLRLIELLFVLLGVIWLLDMLFPLWDAKRQTLHDKVAGSVVVRLRPAG